MLNDAYYKNMDRKFANDSIKRAEKWEKLAKENKAKGYIDLAIVAARQARRCRQDAKIRNLR